MKLLNKLSLATRLSIVFSLISCVIFSGIGWLSYHNAREMIYTQQDKGLVARINRMEAFLSDIGTVDLLVQYPRLYENMIGFENSILIINNPQQNLIEINPEKVQIPIFNKIQNLQFANDQANSPTFRFAYKSFQVGSQQYQVIAGQPWRGVHEVIQQYFWQVVLYSLLGIVLASLLGFWAGQYLFRSMRILVAETQKINVQQLDYRLDVASSNIEVQQLSHAMNEMLDKIQIGYQKLAQFSEDIAHELRIPLNNLMGQTQILLSQPRQTEELENLCYSHLEEYERLTKMIESMLFIARSEHGELVLEKSRVDVKNLLENISEYYDFLVEERHMTLHVSVADDVSVIGNEAFLQRAISNLISNAIAYGQEKGVIEIEAKYTMRGCEISVLTQDTFIDEQHLAHVFDRFYQVDGSRHKKAQTGGLGLAIVQSIVKLHGGWVEVENKEKGVVFKVVLAVKGNV